MHVYKCVLGRLCVSVCVSVNVYLCNSLDQTYRFLSLYVCLWGWGCEVCVDVFVWCVGMYMCVNVVWCMCVVV